MTDQERDLRAAMNAQRFGEEVARQLRLADCKRHNDRVLERIYNRTFGGLRCVTARSMEERLQDVAKEARGAVEARQQRQAQQRVTFG